MDLQTMLNDVLPEGSVLYKHNHGLYDLYLDDIAFEDGREFSSQCIDEPFADFIKRSIQNLIDLEEEENDQEPLVSIDCAIHGGLN